MIKRLICLANSRKLSARCVAGLEWNGICAGSWVRPVGNGPHGGIDEDTIRYADRSYPRLLDIIDVPLLNPLPQGHQNENYLLDPSRRWMKHGELSMESLGMIRTETGTLWQNGCHTRTGLNDQVPIHQLEQQSGSLRLVKVEKIEIQVAYHQTENEPPKRRIRGKFVLCGTDYRLWITDPMIERDYYAKPDGVYPVDHAFLTISLSEPFNDHCYKLIAAIIWGTKY